jgi:hypothetical protein
MSSSYVQHLELPFFANIPYNVQIDENLSDGAKIYFGQIIGLAKKFGYMWATDDQLMQMKKVAKSTIERWHLELEKAGFIRRETHNVPIKDGEGFSWIKKRKIYFNDAMAFGSPKKLELPEVIDSPKNEGTIGTPKNEGTIGTPKNEGIINASLDSILKKQLEPNEVVISSLEKIEISDTLRKKIRQEKSIAEIDIAVERCLRWKSRPSDEIGIMTALSRSDSWSDNPSPEEREEANSKYLKSLNYLDMKTIGMTQISIGNKYIEFSRGPKVIVFNIEDAEFKKQVVEYLEYLRTIEDSLVK